MSRWARVAYIIKTRNLQGSLVARSVPGLPFLLQPGMQVHFVPPTLRGPRTARVAEVSRMHEGEYQVDFEGITSIDDAECLAGCSVLVEKSLLPENYETSGQHDYVGFAVEDALFGELGTVAQVEELPGQDLLVVRGQRGEILIPAVEAYVVGIDEEGEVISVAIPEDLLNLNE